MKKKLLVIPLLMTLSISASACDKGTHTNKDSKSSTEQQVKANKNSKSDTQQQIEANKSPKSDTEQQMKETENSKNDIEQSVQTENVSKAGVSGDKLKNVKKMSFKAKDLNGNEISSDVFKESKITMINIWGTFCKPCINEFPEIQALSEELKDKGVNVIGIVANTLDENYNEDKTNIELANKIVKVKNIKYKNIINNKELNKILPTTGYPTTLFVDKEGNIIGEMIVGARSKDEYKNIILKALANR